MTGSMEGFAYWCASIRVGSSVADVVGDVLAELRPGCWRDGLSWCCSSGPGRRLTGCGRCGVVWSWPGLAGGTVHEGDDAGARRMVVDGVFIESGIETRRLRVGGEEKTWVAVGGQYDLLCPVAVTSDRPVSGMSSRLWPPPGATASRGSPLPAHRGCCRGSPESWLWEGRRTARSPVRLVAARMVRAVSCGDRCAPCDPCATVTRSRWLDAPRRQPWRGDDAGKALVLDA